MRDFLEINEHPLDRLVRIVLGLGLLSLVFIGPKSLLGLVGVVPLLTGLAGACPLYSILGLSTCPASSRDSSEQQPIPR